MVGWLRDFRTGRRVGVYLCLPKTTFLGRSDQGPFGFVEEPMVKRQKKARPKPGFERRW